MPRAPEDLLESALAVVDRAFKEHDAGKVIPLFSGGHDSYCAVRCVSEHPRFLGRVYHIDTGIGSQKTRAFVEAVCKEEGWQLVVLSGGQKNSYEWIVRKFGFPGPSMHRVCYIRLKERALSRLTACRFNRKTRFKQHLVYAMISGGRSQESQRRMRNIGQTPIRPEKGNEHRLWVAPCWDWSSEEQVSFMDAFCMSRNPVKMSPLKMSGECFCGAFARPGELEMIRQICPDVAAEIGRLAAVAVASGKPSVWGGPRGSRKLLEVLPTGPMCTSCDVRAKDAGVQIAEEGWWL